MYEEHFGLKSNPFRSNAEGTDVYVGSAQEKVISRIHKGLSAADNIVTVSGPVGIGKTTIVTRALETNKQNQLVAWIGRMRLAPDEVMQLLLAGFGITRQVPGTVRQFAVFQRLLSEKAAADTRVVIVIEDALRIGDETLLELEAITASDTGNVSGANLILMGPPELKQRLNMPELARLRQRARLGQKIAALNTDDVSVYLEHIVRSAGIEASEIFDDDIARTLFQLSAGVPRVINNICDAALAEAEEEGLKKITRTLMLAVAADVYGLEPQHDESSPVADTRIPDDAAEKAVEIEAIHADPEPKSEPEPEAELPAVVAASLAQEQDEFSAKTNLINITGLQPQIENEPLSELPVKLPEPEPEVDPEPESFNDTADDLPMLSNSMRIDGPITPAPIVNGKIVADTSPTPDLDALEAAITAARGGDASMDRTDTFLPDLNFNAAAPPIDADLPVSNPEPEPEPDAELEHKPWPAPETDLNPTQESEPELVPEAGPAEPVLEFEPEPAANPEPALEFEPEPVTESIPEPVPALEPEPVFDSLAADLPEPVIDTTPIEAAEPAVKITLDKSIDKLLEDQRHEGNKLGALAAEFAGADSLEDMSDMMAETLFGIEFEQIAQEALKNPPAAGTLPGDTDVLASDAFATSDNTTPANDPGEETSPVMLETEEEPKTSTVSVPIIQTLPETDPPQPRVGVPDAEPESIENQFQTEITQTMKTVDPANLPNAELGNDGDKPGGLFGRLKKTFRG